MPTRNGGSILNNVAKGRTNQLLAVSNQCDWATMFVNETIKSEQYSIFLVMVHYLLNFSEKNKDWVLFLQDNATIHHGKLIKRIVTKLDLWMHFLPTYSPEIAAVRLIFGVLQRKIRTTRTAHLIDFGADDGKELIMNSLNSILSDTIIKTWKRAIGKAKDLIVHSKLNMLQNFRSEISLRNNFSDLKIQYFL